MSRPSKSDTAKKTSAKSLTSRAREIGTDCIARSARNVARKLIAGYEFHLAPYGLTLPQFTLMIMIAGAEDDTLAAIAEAADIDPSTLTRNLQGLEKLAFVEIATVEADQRKRSVWLTESGARRLEAAIPAWQSAQTETKALLGPGFVSALLRAESSL